MAFGRRALLLLRSIAVMRQKTRATVTGAGWITLGLFVAGQTAAEAQAEADAAVAEEERRTAAAQLATAHEHIANLQMMVSDVAGAYQTLNSQRDAVAKHTIVVEQRAAAVEAERAAERAHAAGVERRLVAAADEAAALNVLRVADVAREMDMEVAAARAETAAARAEVRVWTMTGFLLTCLQRIAYCLHVSACAPVASDPVTICMQAQVVEMRRAFDALQRRDEDRQRQVDVLLTRELQADLKLQAVEVRSNGLRCTLVLVHAGFTFAYAGVSVIILCRSAPSQGLSKTQDR